MTKGFRMENHVYVGDPRARRVDRVTASQSRMQAHVDVVCKRCGDRYCWYDDGAKVLQRRQEAMEWIADHRCRQRQLSLFGSDEGEGE
jgi:hypothetical protein